MKLALRETSKKFKRAPPFIGVGNDVIVHLHWNAQHKHGGKQSGDINWSIITKPRPLSTQEVWPRLRSVRSVMHYLTILVFGVTAERDSSALSSVSDKPYGEPQ